LGWWKCTAEVLHVKQNRGPGDLAGLGGGEENGIAPRGISWLCAGRCAALSESCSSKVAKPGAAHGPEKLVLEPGWWCPCGSSPRTRLPRGGAAVLGSGRTLFRRPSQSLSRSWRSSFLCDSNCPTARNQ